MKICYYVKLEFSENKPHMASCKDLDWEEKVLRSTPDVINEIQKSLQKKADSLLSKGKLLPRSSKRSEIHISPGEILITISIKINPRDRNTCSCSRILPLLGGTNALISATVSSLVSIVAIEIAAAENKEAGQGAGYTSAVLNFFLTLMLYYASGASDALAKIGTLLSCDNSSGANNKPMSRSIKILFTVGQIFVFVNNVFGAIATFQETISLSTKDTEGNSFLTKQNVIKPIAWIHASSSFVTNALFQSSLAHHAFKKLFVCCLRKPKPRVENEHKQEEKEQPEAVSLPMPHQNKQLQSGDSETSKLIP